LTNCDSFKDLADKYFVTLSEGDLNKAAEIRENIISFKRAFDFNDLFSLAQQTLGSGHHSEAAKLFSFCCKISPEIPEAWLNKGIALLGTPSFEETRDAFETALGLAPNLWRPLYEPNSHGIDMLGCIIGGWDTPNPKPVFRTDFNGSPISVTDSPKFKAALIVNSHCKPEDYEECWRRLMWNEKIVNLCDSQAVWLLEKMLGNVGGRFFNDLFKQGYFYMFGELAPKRLLDPIKSTNIEKGLPFIPLNMMLRSGNHYLSKTLKTFYPSFPVTWTRPTGPLVDLLSYLSDGGFVGRNMEPACQETVEAYLSQGIKEVVVQVRDPRQVTYSLGKFKEKAFSFEYGRNFEDFSESEKIDYWIERELPHLVHFIESWID
jgi:hypothetical protein